MRMMKTAFYGLAYYGLVAIGAVALGTATPAAALTLADLDAGASLSSLDGTLTFQGFNVTLPATVGASPNAFAALDLSTIEVEALPTNGFGFRVIEFDSPLVAVGEQVGQLIIDFDVVASPGFVITGANLAFTGTAIGTGAIARIDETVTYAGGSLSLGAIRQAGGLQQPIDQDVFAAPATSVSASTTITLDTRGSTAMIAQLSEFEPGFSASAQPVPEPGAFVIFGGSLALVLTASRRRWL